MTIVPFPRAQRRGEWRPDELEQLIRVFETHARKHAGASWDIGSTEAEDPQFYIVGGLPERDCLVSISRLGSLYVLEDGSGHVVAEDAVLGRILDRAVHLAFGRQRASLATRAFVALCSLRLAVEEKVEIALEESEELVLRLAPQLAALI